MENIVLDQIPFAPDMQLLSQKLHIREGSSRQAELEALAREAQSLACPRAIYRVAFIEEKKDNQVIIDGIRFTSRVLRANLDPLHRVFPYVVTCGRELAAWAQSFQDMLPRFYADAIQESALRKAINALKDHLVGLYIPEISRKESATSGPTLADMNPGSLEDWPIEEQIPLFRLLGNVGETIGVTLTESLLMQPVKSVSGIYFASEESYVNCRLCPRDICPSRKATYEPGLYKQQYEHR